MGDPCGIGPEIIVKAFDSPGFASRCIPLVIGDRLPLERAIKLLGSSAVIRPMTGYILTPFRSGALMIDSGTIPLLPPAAQNGSLLTGLTAADMEFGKPSPAACETAVSCIRTAVDLATAGLVDAVCTCPINKEQLHRQGFPFAGHTEFIRELTGAEDVVMMLAGPGLRVALATIHVSLADVPGLLTKELLRKVIRITAESMSRDFAVKSPRIGVAGLNPHAGEAGKFGRGEIEVIRPVIEEFEAAPVQTGGGGLCARISGPWPADTVFHRAMSNEFDAVVAMYHDQGLIPVKLVHFNEAVNVSLGLPVVRTSVDHGTAYDIAGMGTADPGSLIEAVSLAATIARNRKNVSS
ncbi:MAG: 4-hydroxythreonine-4-phosphate dehydrogenase PdxA [Syntrophobacteraceae bacterium]|jgi:4-hydroxythreonine-4-phosphate dehydrogenase